MAQIQLDYRVSIGVQSAAQMIPILNNSDAQVIGVDGGALQMLGMSLASTATSFNPFEPDVLTRTYILDLLQSWKVSPQYSGLPLVTASGMTSLYPAGVFNIAIVTAGGYGVGEFIWNYNGGAYSAPTTIAATVALGATGVTLAFPDAGYPVMPNAAGGNTTYVVTQDPVVWATDDAKKYATRNLFTDALAVTLGTFVEADEPVILP